MWPVDTDPTKRTAFDRLSLFCTTLSNTTSASNTYSIQRHDPTSPTFDYSGISRNPALYQYLQNLTSHAVPGFGSTSFKTKWDIDRDQILTEIFDYIRSTNLRDPQYPTASNLNYTYNSQLGRANGQVTPIVINGTKGFGRFHSISQFGFQFICTQQANTGAYTTADPTIKFGPDDRIVETSFLFEPFSPSLGFFRLSENMTFQVNFDPKNPLLLDGQDLKMRGGSKSLFNGIGQGYHNNGREHGGTGGIRGPIYALGANSQTGYQYLSLGDPMVYLPKTAASNAQAIPGVKISTAGGKNTMHFSGGHIQVLVFSGGTTGGAPVQTFEIDFPGGDFPIPDLVTTGTDGYRNNDSSNEPTNKERWWTFSGFFGPPSPKSPQTHGPRYAGRYADSQPLDPGEKPLPENVLDVPQAPGAEYLNPARRWDVSGNGTGGGQPGFKSGSVFRREDVVRTVVPDHGDMRLVAANATVGTGTNVSFVKVRTAEWDSPYRFLHIFQNNSGPHFMFGFSNEPNANGQAHHEPVRHPGFPTYGSTHRQRPSRVSLLTLARDPAGSGQAYNRYGDFDNGPAQWIDGAYINKPDEGSESVTNSVGGVNYDYWSWNDSTDFTTKFFSPNRVIPSPGMLGSLPVGVKRGPSVDDAALPAAAHRQAASIPGSAAPIDHQIMDLFWMPVVEPYAISEPFSTGGKVNMNYEIAPFTYIRRTTALHGAFKGEMPMVIPNSAGPAYKLWDHETNDNGIMPDSPRDKDPNVASLWKKGVLRRSAPFDTMRMPIDLESSGAQVDDSAIRQ